MIEKLVRKEVKSLPSGFWYKEPPKHRIILDSGENVISVTSNVRKSIKASVDNINRYPDPTQSKLKKALAEYNKCKFENIVVTNGSDEAIELLAKTFLNKNDKIITLTPSFPTYKNAALLMGAKVIEIKLNNDFSFPVEKLISSIDRKVKIIFIANPNNPTGNLLVNERNIKSILKKFSGLLVLDECYYELCKKTFLYLIKDYKNLVILRSMSKTYSLAGLRIGYIIANKDVVSWLKRVSDTLQPFRVNAIAQAAALKSFESEATIQKFLKTKRKFYSKLKEIKGIKVYPSETTFFLIELKTKNSLYMKKMLEKYGISIKDCSAFGLEPRYILKDTRLSDIPKTSKSSESSVFGYIRIGVPAEKDMLYVINILKKILHYKYKNKL